MDCKCVKCKWEWQARVDVPVQCPRCKQYDWLVKKENEVESK